MAVPFVCQGIIFAFDTSAKQGSRQPMASRMSICSSKTLEFVLSQEMWTQKGVKHAVPYTARIL